SNAVFHGNGSRRSGGAFSAGSASVLNATVVGNSGGGNVFAGNSGSVFNSVFWQNSGGDIPNSWTAQHSSFSSVRAGAGNISGDPKFIDISKAAGTAHFFGYDAGLILAGGSSALKGSKDVAGTLEQDLIGTERGNEVAMGAYGDYSDDGNTFQYGEWAYGKFEPRPDMPQPLFTKLPNYEIMDYVGHGGYGRMIKRLVRKHDKTKISKATVRITVLDSAFNKYPDIAPVDVVFYRRTDKDEDGKYVFETLTNWPLYPDYDPEKHGRLILFSMDPDDQGIHEGFLVIYVKSANDNFRYEVVE
ncbi:MAG: hypothetical protein LBU89_06775, partial [Fibromonadaceae bacterium]|nr:hypothetical protein [Fibromonadaceae bacterium]